MNSNMKIKISSIPAPDQLYSRALGITQEREVEIIGIIQQYYLEHQGDDLKATVAISGEMQNPNELAFAMLQYGICAGSMHEEEETYRKLAA